jgi:membrane-associated protein
MLVTAPNLVESLESWILALATSPWIYPALLGSTTLDGIFPPVPSESMVIVLAVSARTTGEPHLLFVLLVAAVGAWSGDQVAFMVGRGVGTGRARRAKHRRLTTLRIEQTLADRGASFILAARYVPVGRIAVNMAAGAVGYPHRRFAWVSGVAAVTWATYSMLIGLVAGRWLGHRPLLAMAVGIVVGATTGFAIDRIRAMRTHRKARSSEAA